MPVHNSDIASIFDQMADILEIQAANAFRVRAYRNAARVVGNWPADLAELIRQGRKIPKMPGLGKDLTQKVEEIAGTGHLKALDDLKKKTPGTLVELLNLPGLGPKRVQMLQKKLHVESVGELENALKSGRLRELRGFGEKLIGKIQDAVARRAGKAQRVLLSVAEQTALPFLAHLRKAEEIVKAEIAGSFRRRRETVGDIDILVSARKDSDVVERFVRYEDVTEILARGETKATVMLRSGLQVDLRVVPEESYGSALHYFTGSKAHNIAIRRMGMQRKLKINEYGIFRGARRIGGKNEEEVFAAVGLPYIEPELRENQGEIEAAREGRLPKLLTLKEIRGDFHAHTDETDGRLGMEQMAAAAEALGYEYLAISDHTKHLSVTRGLTPERLRAQIRKIDRFNEKSGKIKLLKASEVDILEDGSLDLPDELLAKLDVTVCSIHTKFDLPEKKQTERILRAMDNPYFHILGHPSGRLIGTREPYPIDIERIIEAARERGCFIELNAQPDRMDLNDQGARLAKEKNVKIVISTDAHSDHDLLNMRFGVSMARRGWLEAGDVLNTRPWAEIRRMLRKP